MKFILANLFILTILLMSPACTKKEAEVVDAPAPEATTQESNPEMEKDPGAVQEKEQGEGTKTDTQSDAVTGGEGEPEGTAKN